MSGFSSRPLPLAGEERGPSQSDGIGEGQSKLVSHTLTSPTAAQRVPFLPRTRWRTT